MTKSDWDYRGLAAECYDLWFGEEPFWDQAFFMTTSVTMAAWRWKSRVGQVACWCRFCAMASP
jgi:hypothetical protein